VLVYHFIFDHVKENEDRTKAAGLQIEGC
jgi:hypothetical protein